MQSSFTSVTLCLEVKWFWRWPEQTALQEEAETCQGQSENVPVESDLPAWGFWWWPAHGWGTLVLEPKWPNFEEQDNLIFVRNSFTLHKLDLWVGWGHFQGEEVKAKWRAPALRAKTHSQYPDCPVLPVLATSPKWQVWLHILTWSCPPLPPQLDPVPFFVCFAFIFATAFSWIFFFYYRSISELLCSSNFQPYSTNCSAITSENVHAVRDC